MSQRQLRRSMYLNRIPWRNPAISLHAFDSNDHPMANEIRGLSAALAADIHRSGYLAAQAELLINRIAGYTIVCGPR